MNDYKKFIIENISKLDDEIKNSIHEAFDEAEDVKDTIWYKDNCTLYDEILFRIDKWLENKYLD